MAVVVELSSTIVNKLPALSANSFTDITSAFAGAVPKVNVEPDYVKSFVGL